MTTAAMTMATLTSKGQVTLPKAIRRALGLEKGDQVVFRLRDDGIVELEPRKVDLMSLCGVLEPEVRGVTIEDMNEPIAEAASDP